MRQVDPNVVWQKIETWDANYQQNDKQISVPAFLQVEKPPQLFVSIPPTYIHTNVVYPDENHYSCDEDDQRHGIDPLVMQQLDIRRNLNRSRNYCRQIELLNNIDYSWDYYDQKVERLKRPLLRVFMRAHENDYRMNVAFRPSKAYKQRRQKRLNLNLEEFETARRVISIENQIALQLFSLLRHREQIKLKLLQSEAGQLVQPLQLPSTEGVEKLFQRLKELRTPPQIEAQPAAGQAQKIYEACNDQDCAYRFAHPQIEDKVLEFIDDQYCRQRQLAFPRHPTVLSSWLIDDTTRLGVHMNSQQIVYKHGDRVLFVSDQSKKQKKRVKVMLVKQNRASVFEGVRANYEHFQGHYIRVQQKWEQQIDQSRREIQRVRQEVAKKEQQQRKREEMRQAMKFRLNVNQIRAVSTGPSEPAPVQKSAEVKKTVKIKWAEGTHFILVDDDSTRIVLRRSGDQVIVIR